MMGAGTDDKHKHKVKDDDEFSTSLRVHSRPRKHTRSDFDSLTDDEKAQIEGEYKYAGCYDCWLCRCCDAFGYCTGIKCCCCHLGGQRPFLGIEHNRSFTDVPCCFLFLAALIFQAFIFNLAYTKGADPRKLLYFPDYQGNLCAPGTDFPAGNYAAWPDIRLIDIVICVNNCSETLTDPRMVTPPFDFDVTDYTAQEILAGDFSGYNTSLLFNAYCIPNMKMLVSSLSTVSASLSNFTKHFDNVGNAVSIAISDVDTCKFLFIACSFVTLLLSFLWGFLIRHCGGTIIWTSILFTILGLFLIAYYLITYSVYVRAFGWDLVSNIMYYGGIILAVLDGLFTLAICFMWNRILLALAIVKEATRSLQTLWSLFFYPVVPFIFFILYVTYWIATGLYIGSVIKFKSQPIPDGQYIPYYDSPVTGPTLFDKLGETTYRMRILKPKWQYAFLYHFFVLIWVCYFISYHTYSVVCGVYAEWYFADWTNEKEISKKHGNKANELPTCPVFSSFYRTTRYHLGTIAFASLLIAIIEFIEWTLTYFEKKFINAEASPVKKCVLCVVHCLLKCLKCILNRINKNGLTITAIYGWPFCAASIKGIIIVVKNVIRASAMSLVSGYLERLGTLAIVALSTGIMMIMTYYIYGDGRMTNTTQTVTSLIGPGIIYFAISLLICWNFMHLYEVGLRTIFICFLIDEERNRGGYMKASRRLRQAINEAQPKRYELVNRAKGFRGDMIDPDQRQHFAGVNDNLNYQDYKVLSKTTKDLPLSSDEITKLGEKEEKKRKLWKDTRKENENNAENYKTSHDTEMTKMDTN